jgi:hypothetical protein
VQFETFDQEGEKHAFLEKVVTSVVVRSSTGETRERYVIRKKIKLGAYSHEINVNLNDREGLQYRFLVGRNLLMGQYTVDVAQTRVLGK